MKQGCMYLLKMMPTAVCQGKKDNQCLIVLREAGEEEEFCACASVNTFVYLCKLRNIYNVTPANRGNFGSDGDGAGGEVNRMTTTSVLYNFVWFELTTDMYI